MLSASGGWKLSVNGLSFERLDEFEVEGLKKPFTEEEVFGALLCLSGDKALG